MKRLLYESAKLVGKFSDNGGAWEPLPVGMLEVVLSHQRLCTAPSTLAGFFPWSARSG